MRRRSGLLVVAFGLLCLALLLPAAASAIPGHHSTPAFSAAAGGAPPANPLFAPRLASPLYTLAGSATLKIHVLGFWSDPNVGAHVGWFVGTDTDHASGIGVTDGNGLVTFTGVPAASTSNGEIAVAPVSTDMYDYVFYDLWNLGWSDPAGIDMAVQPGSVSLDVTTGGPWPAYDAALAVLYSQNGGAQQESVSVIRQTDATPGSVTSGTPLVLGSDLGAGAIEFWLDEGTEISLDGLHTSPGTSVASGINVNQADAQRMVPKSAWGSGKPGSSFVIRFQNFPPGWVNQLSGFSEGNGAGKSFGSSTSDGTDRSKTFTIPKSASPGFMYDITATHRDGPLSLTEPFQVCTLVPSKASLSAPGPIRFSGRVPFKKGSRKTVILYRRTASAGQPLHNGGFASWNGWKKIATFRTDTAGRYRSPLVNASRTAWYVLWYPANASSANSSYHWAAWTSVVKVGVR
jgi:hypothetical protein